MSDHPKGGGGGGDIAKVALTVGVCTIALVVLFNVMVKPFLIAAKILPPDLPMIVRVPDHVGASLGSASRGGAQPRNDICPQGQKSIGYRRGEDGQLQHGCRKIPSQETRSTPSQNPCPVGQTYLGTRIGPDGQTQYGCRKTAAQCRESGRCCTHRPPQFFRLLLVPTNIHGMLTGLRKRMHVLYKHEVRGVSVEGNYGLCRRSSKGAKK